MLRVNKLVFGVETYVFYDK